MRTRFRRFHIETHGSDGSTELDISGEKEVHKGEGPSDRSNLNAWLNQTVRTYARHVGPGRSSASSQSSCSANTEGTVRVSGQASAQGPAKRERRVKLDLSECD